jgi:hypothetical protein
LCRYHLLRWSFNFHRRRFTISISILIFDSDSSLCVAANCNQMLAAGYCCSCTPLHFNLIIIKLIFR